MSTEQQIRDKVVCLSVEIHRLGINRKADSKVLKPEADREMVRANKSILEAESFGAIMKLDAAVGNYLRLRTLPSPLRKGVYMLPIALQSEVEGRLCELAAERGTKVEAFIAEYPSLIQEAERRLAPSGLFEAGNYPTPEAAKSKFAIEWYYLDFRVPGSMEKLDKGLFEAEQQKHKNLWDEATEVARQVLRTYLSELVDHAVEKLGSSETGKKKVFRDSMIPKWQEFLGTFDARNITDDTELKALVEKARGLLAGVDNGILRSDDSVRTKVRSGLGEVKATLDAMIVAAPVRSLNLDEE